MKREEKKRKEKTQFALETSIKMLPFFFVFWKKKTDVYYLLDGLIWADEILMGFEGGYIKIRARWHNNLNHPSDWRYI